jgi:heme A synthase
MLIAAYLGRLPRNMKWLTWLLFGVYVIQADVIIFMRDSIPFVSAFHPVLALVDFALAAILVYQAWTLVQNTREERTAQEKLEQLDKIGL